LSNLLGLVRQTSEMLQNVPGRQHRNPDHLDVHRVVIARCVCRRCRIRRTERTVLDLGTVGEDEGHRSFPEAAQFRRTVSRGSAASSDDSDLVMKATTVERVEKRSRIVVLSFCLD